MLHFVAWAIGAVETWLGLWLMGYPSTFSQALATESLVLVPPTTAFCGAWAAGVQQGII